LYSEFDMNVEIGGWRLAVGGMSVGLKGLD
jgi:hypothetical protein